jgi:hypothetical protein
MSMPTARLEPAGLTAYPFRLARMGSRQPLAISAGIGPVRMHECSALPGRKLWLIRIERERHDGKCQCIGGVD